MNLDELIDDAMNEPEMVDPDDTRPTDEAAGRLKQLLKETQAPNDYDHHT